MKARPQRSLASGAPNPYAAFAALDGDHPFKRAVPGAYVDYPARTRRGGKVMYFNFELAKEMGLVPEDHVARLTPELARAILDTFALVIINENDVMNGRVFPPEDIRPGKYMATRYLQLQHPNKAGTTSGDGRGIWNGRVSRGGRAWDVSSCGTGATCLSPAVALEKKFFRTGDRKVGYGNGYSTIDEGIGAALMSEIFHRNGIGTERALAVIEFPGGSSIYVRASPNLLRPSHLFNHLKQGNLRSLRSAVDYFIERQVENGDWPRTAVAGDAAARYAFFADAMADAFAGLAARLQREYIFVWLDWDGDNVLASGGIIDYGSVRRFGLYHREYRYEDVDRYSTSIPEQRRKARQVVQRMAQIRDYLVTGRRRGLAHYARDRAVRRFDACFVRECDRLLLLKMGFTSAQTAYLQREHAPAIRAFEAFFARFEEAASARGVYPVSDGITADAIYCMSDILRELPRLIRARGGEVEAGVFLETIRSRYARDCDVAPTPKRLNRVAGFQRTYRALVRLVAHRFHEGSERNTLLGMMMRASQVNREDRLTGNGAIFVTENLVRNRKKLGFRGICATIWAIIRHQDWTQVAPTPREVRSPGIARHLKLIRDHSEGI